LELFLQKCRDNWEDGNPGSWGTSPQYQVKNLACLDPINNSSYSVLLLYVCEVMKMFFFQPGSPPSGTYEAPTPGSGWASTPGGNYSEAGTPRDSSSAYGSLFFSFLCTLSGDFFIVANFMHLLQPMLQAHTCHQLLVASL
jgi:transcription elongation factor SPT5